MILKETTARNPKIKELYLSSFPEEERKSISFIEKLRKEGKCTVLKAEENGIFAGLAIMLTDEKYALIDYLAVDTKSRGTGLGSKILDCLKEKYGDKCLFLERETVTHLAENAFDRSRRRRFYLNNGFSDTGIYVNVYTVDMTLMTYESIISFEEYAAFLHKTVGDKIFNIIKVVKSNISDENI